MTKLELGHEDTNCKARFPLTPALSLRESVAEGRVRTLERGKGKRLGIFRLRKGTCPV